MVFMLALSIFLVSFDVMMAAADFFVLSLAGLLGFVVVPYVVLLYFGREDFERLRRKVLVFGLFAFLIYIGILAVFFLPRLFM